MNEWGGMDRLGFTLFFFVAFDTTTQGVPTDYGLRTIPPTSVGLSFSFSFWSDIKTSILTSTTASFLVRSTHTYSVGFVVVGVVDIQVDWLAGLRGGLVG
jgi:hypothetical protein